MTINGQQPSMPEASKLVAGGYPRNEDHHRYCDKTPALRQECQPPWQQRTDRNPDPHKQKVGISLPNKEPILDPVSDGVSLRFPSARQDNFRTQGPN
jgi:hypothetical protein